jgi:hypothetical protein
MVVVSRFLGEKGRFFGKVKVVDVVVILAVIALIVFAVIRVEGPNPSSTVPLQVTFRVQHVPQATVAGLLGAHGTLKVDTGTILGKVLKVTAQPSQEEVLNPVTGKLEVQSSPLYEDVDIVISARAVSFGGTYRIGSVAISQGGRVNIVGTPSFIESGLILDVTKASK